MPDASTRSILPWFPGYTVTAVATVALLATAPGQTFIVSTIKQPLQDTYGLSEIQFNTMYTFATVLAALPLVAGGRLADRLGPRKMLALNAGVFALGCGAMAAVFHPIAVFVGLFLLRFLGQGMLALTSQHAVAMWFHRRLGTMHGLKQLVVFALWSPLPLATTWLIGVTGWRVTYMIFGALIALAVVPAALLLVRDRPEDVGLRTDNDPPDGPPPHEDEPPHAVPEYPDEPEPPDELLDEPVSALPGPVPLPPGEFTFGEAVRTRAYWMLAVVFAIPPLIGTALLLDMPGIAGAEGLTGRDAASIVGAWTLAMSLMAFPSGWLTDRLPPALVVAIGFVLHGVCAVGVILGGSVAVLAGSMALMGVGQSLVSTCAGATAARYFGRSHHGAIRSSLTRIAVVGTGLGPLFTGASADWFERYTSAMLAFVVMSAIGVAASVVLRQPGAPAKA